MRIAERSGLTASLTSDEFQSWYWLKEELVEFAREHRISTTGLKREIEVRISSYLSGKVLRSRTQSVRRTGLMPNEFNRDMVTGEGWRCGPALGRFFRGELGNGFRFNAAMREFIHTCSGKTLAEAATCYQKSVALGRERSEIPEQLEYNRHFREYFKVNAGATREEAIAAWWAKRGKRRS